MQTTDDGLVDNELIILTCKTVDVLMALGNAADSLALYVFYYRTAKKQRTNQVKATREYVRKGLSWGVERYQRAQNALEEAGLVEKLRTVDDAGKVNGWYVKLRYIFKNHTSQNQKVDSPAGGFQTTNALSRQKEMLKVDKRNTMSNSKESDLQVKQIFDLYLEQFEASPARFKLSAARKIKIKARLRDAGIEMLTDAIKNTAASEFHRGDNDRQWKANLDFIIRSYEQVERLSGLDTPSNDAEELRKKWQM